jgi:Protein of unknown function (DUF3500)
VTQLQAGLVRSSTAELANRMATSVTAWLKSLSPEQRAIAEYGPPGDSAAENDRLTWFFTPTDHGGLTLNAQTPRQQSLAMQVVSSGLSMGGYVTACTIIGSENILDRVEDFKVDWGRERGRDPGLYYLRVFGDPQTSKTWAWRFGGHHISLNNLVVDGEVASTTPNFFGQDPAEIAFMGAPTLRPLGGSEDLARELLHTLSGEARNRAVLLDRAVSDIISGNRARLREGDEMIHMQDLWRGRFAEPRLADYVDFIDERAESQSGYTAADHTVLALTTEPKGLPASALDDGQRELLRKLIRTFYGRVPEEVSRAEAEFYADDANLDAVHFAWAGGGERGDQHYFRVQGPRLLIEYDNTQRGGNHVHTVWRDPVADFGLDVLYEHLEAFHPLGR